MSHFDASFCDTAPNGSSSKYHTNEILQANLVPETGSSYFILSAVLGIIMLDSRNLLGRIKRKSSTLKGGETKCSLRNPNISVICYSNTTHCDM